MSEAIEDKTIEAIVSEFSDLLQRRLYELQDANSRALAAKLRTAAAELEQTARPWPTAADCGPNTAKVSADDPQQPADTTI